MTDIEKRAHDIAIAILPKMLEEEKLPFYASLDGVHPYFNAGDIIDVYCKIYEDLLTELRGQGEL